ncbi:alpha/beta superfamily [Methanosarcina horonobensis HB-1 = JCM 15518]|uniref:Alpha/beta superfamily n=1 Tax=Methanosarcina horonobensis HB-1 = JCM 15518 TaxID=1434110 RepID=A0A0E3SJ03_9EURY|nr:alpha/beta hydrolase [Methanosarcina horonobensis]AKB80522.1 alpha/beta superfamily [Methanosarcina horonobensis HB-1 = JCM 15518]
MKRSSSGTRTPKPAVFVLGFLFILVGIFGILYNPSNSLTETLTWKVSEAGILSFSEREGSVFTIQKIEDLYSPENPDTLKLISFESRGDKVQALLRVPANASSSSPGVILLPGAGVSKEGEQGLAVELSKMGYATLTLDQRNQGSINVERDLELFRADLEPVEYLMVYDVLKAADVLASQPEIDPERLAVLGESNGGKFAIIACALDPSLKGVIGISTSGYGTEEIDPASVTDSEAYRFYLSIDPDTYLNALPPSKFVMIHSFNDTIISHELALRTFAIAEEPKAMYNTTEETHGYTASMRPYLEKELALILS